MAPIFQAFVLALIIGMVSSTNALFSKTVVSIQGTQFYINGKATYSGSSASGLLLNSKMTQAIFDDENSLTSTRWSYPDTHSWNASRNTAEFISNISLYNSKGLNAVTVGMQGSDPDPSDEHSRDCIVTAFTNNGALKSSWTQRLLEVLKVMDQQQMVVILNLFDLNQEWRLNGDDSAIISAVQAVVQTIVQNGFTNVMLDLADSCSPDYTHQLLTPNGITFLLKLVKTIAPHILVSTSFPSGILPPDNVIGLSDFVLLHATQLNRTGLNQMIRTLRQIPAYKRNPTPIIINQDSSDIGNLEQAVSDGVSWGFYSQGLNNYNDGYCSPPVNWGINTVDKQAFFDEAVLLTQS